MLDGCVYFVIVQGIFMQIKVGVFNIFMFNGDEQNDFFNFVVQANIEDLEVLEFKVYNCWGQFVYDNEMLDDGWDGNVNGKEQFIEVYFYFICIV